MDIIIVGVIALLVGYCMGFANAKTKIRKLIKYMCWNKRITIDMYYDLDKIIKEKVR